MFTKNILDYQFPTNGLSAIGSVERDTVSTPGMEFIPHPEGGGWTRPTHDVQGTHTQLWAEGFLYENKGFSVYAKFPKPVLLAEDHPDSRPRSDEAAFMREVTRIWPGVAAHG